MLDVEEDVEKCLLADPLPAGCAAAYDVDPDVVLTGYPPGCTTAHVPLLNWSSETLRMDIVRQLVHFIDHLPPVRPFTASSVARAMNDRDLSLFAYVVHPAFVSRLSSVEAGRRGERVFVHDSVPPATAFALCEPEYLGRLPSRDGLRGCFIYNPRGVIWGSLTQMLS